MTDRAAARAAKELLRAELAPLGGIGGIGIGRREGSYVLTVNVTVDELVRRVPASVEGVPVEVRVSGPVRPLREGTRAGRVTNAPASSGPRVPPVGRTAPATPAPVLPATPPALPATPSRRGGPASGH